MGRMKLMLDTNILVDYLKPRPAFFEPARLLMLCGRLGEFDLWMTSSQMTDLIYILSEGGRKDLMPEVLQGLRGLRQLVGVYPVGPDEVDGMLASPWSDPEDALLYETALSVGADAIITRNKEGFEESALRAMDCEELFQWLERDFGLTYAEMALSAQAI